MLETNQEACACEHWASFHALLASIQVNVHMPKKISVLSHAMCFLMFTNYYCSSGHQGAILAALIPGVNIIKMLLIGLGIWKDEATVKSMSRFGDHRLHFYKFSFKTPSCYKWLAHGFKYLEKYSLRLC